MTALPPVLVGAIQLNVSFVSNSVVDVIGMVGGSETVAATMVASGEYEDQP
jgi:hypothetical protein